MFGLALLGALTLQVPSPNTSEGPAYEAFPAAPGGCGNDPQCQRAFRYALWEQEQTKLRRAVTTAGVFAGLGLLTIGTGAVLFVRYRPGTCDGFRCVSSNSSQLVMFAGLGVAAASTAAFVPLVLKYNRHRAHGRERGYLVFDPATLSLRF